MATGDRGVEMNAKALVQAFVEMTRATLEEELFDGRCPLRIILIHSRRAPYPGAIVAF